MIQRYRVDDADKNNEGQYVAYSDYLYDMRLMLVDKATMSARIWQLEKELKESRDKLDKIKKLINKGELYKLLDIDI